MKRIGNGDDSARINDPDALVPADDGRPGGERKATDVMMQMAELVFIGSGLVTAGALAVTVHRHAGAVRLVREQLAGAPDTFLRHQVDSFVEPRLAPLTPAWIRPASTAVPVEMPVSVASVRRELAPA